MSIIYIYSLSTKEEPNNIRYIGKTKDLKDRLKRHLNKYYLDEGTYKARWLNKVLKLGQTPIIDIIDIVDEKEWQFWEQYWICQFKCWGFKLTNTTLGGEGLILTPEIIKKRSLSNLGKKISKKSIERAKITRRNNAIKNGYWMTEEKKKQISKTLTGFKHSEETKRKLREIKKHPDYKHFEKHSDKTIELLKSISKRKTVLQLNLNGNIINEFKSIRDAEKFTNINRAHISKCCNNKPLYKTAGGYIWKFKD